MKKTDKLVKYDPPNLEGRSTAIFSVWHNISGAVLAGIYRRIDDQSMEE